MSTIMPQSELTRKAVTWVCEEKETTSKPLAVLLEEAAVRFNLGPKDTLFMERFFAEKEAGESRKS